ncbi:hypothetical protein [Streptomyces sp. NPDC048606]|uniref:hypothetical protein n=1 Tax=Streptomyces sp. NPDC048606 TaxID=3154726 RepID=UPI00341BEAD8
MPTVTAPHALREPQLDFLELLRIPVLSSRHAQETELCVAACGAFCFHSGSGRRSPRVRAGAQAPA